jgi:hypothetical protein
MQRGELSVSGRPAIYFVFDGLIADLANKRLERGLIRLHKWEMALDLWTFNVKVCDWMHTLIGRDHPVDVLTWHTEGFAQVLSDRLYSMDVPVQTVHATEYRFASHRLATDHDVVCVYDPDPSHRFGYGFKCREFSPSTAMM